ncbi:MAG: HAD family hydrolase [Clostridia bacterium]|nr:HAD family hydrolase [Clostridia bacterium]
MISCCIFDLDGTLLNTLDTIHYYVNRAMGECGYPSITRDSCRSFVGNGARLLIERAMRSVGEKNIDRIAEVHTVYNKMYDAEPLYLTAPYDGIPELLKELRANGIRIAVLSNKPHSATEPIVKAIFGDLVDIVRGGVDGVPLKPDPTAGKMLLDALKCRPSNCAFIGDTSVDVDMGRAMGVGLTVGVSWGFRDREELLCADCIADTSEDVLKAILNS